MLSWGNNEYGMLGNGTTNNCAVPMPIPMEPFEGRKIVKSSTGTNHTVLLTECGHIYVCGDDQFGNIETVGSHSVEDVAVHVQLQPTLVVFPNFHPATSCQINAVSTVLHTIVATKI